jgi:NAD(P)-dependent dehydrogenase (short-subunit alcohol dehydrogenase family)
VTEPADSYLPAEATGSAPGRGRLAGRRVLVVGAGTRPSPEPDPPVGNGRAIAILAAREGASVVCADRDQAAAEVTAEMVRAEGARAEHVRADNPRADNPRAGNFRAGNPRAEHVRADNARADNPRAGNFRADAERVRAEVVVADVADSWSCATVVEDSIAALGGLDGLVLNVGVAFGRGMAGTTAEQWDATFAVNTRAHFLVSAASLRAATGVPAYDSSKAALLGICRQVAREGMTRHIRANLVVPSLVDTPLGREASRLNPARTAHRLPFGRQATAWEVAYATVWLLSSEASYVNAHPLVLDGGATSFA